MVYDTEQSIVGRVGYMVAHWGDTYSYYGAIPDYGVVCVASLLYFLRHDRVLQLSSCFMHAICQEEGILEQIN